MKESFYYALGRKYKKARNSNQNNIEFISENNKILLFINMKLLNEYYDKYDKSNENINIEFVRLKVDSSKMDLSLCKIIE